MLNVRGVSFKFPLLIVGSSNNGGTNAPGSLGSSDNAIIESTKAPVIVPTKSPSYTREPTAPKRSNSPVVAKTNAQDVENKPCLTSTLAWTGI